MRTDWSSACRRFLKDVAAGNVMVTIEPIVVHELTYAISRVRKDLDRKAVADTILVLLSGAGVDEPTGLIAGAVEAWRDTPQLSFVDAYLGAKSLAEDRPVYTVNRKDFLRQGVDAPDLRELMGTG